MDIITIAFGIRNVADMDRVFREMFRVLVDGGKTIVLEFSLPHNIFVRRLYLIYFRYVLPLIGGTLSGDRSAYRYLNRTVEDFPYGRAFCHRLELAGFTIVNHASLTFGIAALYIAEKKV